MYFYCEGLGRVSERCLLNSFQSGFWVGLCIAKCVTSFLHFVALLSLSAQCLYWMQLLSVFITLLCLQYKCFMFKDECFHRLGANLYTWDNLLMRSLSWLSRLIDNISPSITIYILVERHNVTYIFCKLTKSKTGRKTGICAVNYRIR